MSSNDFNKNETYVGKIVSIDYTSWIVKFRVPGLIDNMEEYPEAVPMFHHVYQLSPDDEIIIIRPSVMQNDTFFYMPITIFKQVGLWFFGNVIDLTNDGVIQVVSNNLNIDLANTLCITCGKTKITIQKNGNINIVGNVEVTGKMSAKGCASAVSVSPMGEVLTFENGLLVETH